MQKKKLLLNGSSQYIESVSYLYIKHLTIKVAPVYIELILVHLYLKILVV